MICSSTTPGPIEKLVGLQTCCIGAAVYGPDRCTCWRPIYDLADQADPRTDLQAEQRAQMCGDCAYRPDSPERQGDPRAAHSAEGELDTVAMRHRFSCHQGMRRIIAWRHDKLGITIDADLDAYDPPIIDGVAYQADGTPGLLCAGWAARRRQLLAEVDS